MLTEYVNIFIMNQINCWLLLLEILISCAVSDIESLTAVSAEKQKINSVIISMMICTLHLIFSAKTLSQVSELWQLSFKSRKHSELSSDMWKLHRLSYCISIYNHRTVWLSEKNNLISWVISAFTLNVLQKLSLAQNVFFNMFRCRTHIQTALTQQSYTLNVYHNKLFECWQYTADLCIFNQQQSEIFFLSHELIVAVYINQIYSVLSAQYCNITKLNISNVKKFVSYLSSSAQKRHNRLIRVIVEKLIEFSSHLILSCSVTVHCELFLHFSHTQFSQYNTGLWNDKLCRLFMWDNQSAVSIKHCQWDNLPFWQLIRQFHVLVKQTMRNLSAQHFLNTINWHIFRWLWIISQYNIDKLSVQIKTLKHNSETSQTYLCSLNAFQCINWIFSAFLSHMICNVNIVCSHPCTARQYSDAV